MTGRGRPLRFLALLTIGWVGARVAILWPQGGWLPGTIELVPLAQGKAPPVLPAKLRAREPVVPSRREISLVPGRASGAQGLTTPRAPVPRPMANPGSIQAASAGSPHYDRPEMPAAPGRISPETAQPVAMPPRPDRWSASIWMAMRPGTGLGAAPGAGQLGGSQAGLRLAYLVLPEKRIVAFARVSAPFQGKGAEGALGIEWQPTRAPVRLVAEQRFGLDGVRGGTGIGIIAGIDIPVPADFRLEAYGQAGAIRRARIEPYADGAARVTRVMAEGGGVRLSFGAGIWGAAQRDAGRLDLGPSAMLAVPIGGRSVRLALDWRQRVAGNARPGSGPALTIGGDF